MGVELVVDDIAVDIGALRHDAHHGGDDDVHDGEIGDILLVGADEGLDAVNVDLLLEKALAVDARAQHIGHDGVDIVDIAHAPAVVTVMKTALIIGFHHVFHREPRLGRFRSSKV